MRFKKHKQSKILIVFVIAIAMFGVSSAVLPKQTYAASAKCYSTNRDGTIELIPSSSCNISTLNSAGFNTQGLPNPLPNDKCYVWGSSADSRGIERNCNDSTLINAPTIGSGSPTPDTAALPTRNTDVIKIEGDCKGSDLSQNCGIVRYLVIFINALSAIVGVVIVIMIIIGGIEYSSAGNNPQQLQAARSKVINALLALVVFIFMYAFLQWLVPGGVFR